MIKQKKELISMNEKPNTTNYIENAINFKNLQDRQKINQTGDKLYRFGSDKMSNVMSPTQVNSSTGCTYQSISRSTTAQTPQQKENTAQFLPTTPIIEKGTRYRIVLYCWKTKKPGRYFNSRLARMAKFACCKGIDTKEFRWQNSLPFYLMREAIC